MKNINIYTNTKEESLVTKKILSKKLKDLGYTINSKEKPCLNISIGGDGSFLKAVRDSGYCQSPFVGINTGHLGFYQEVNPDNIDQFIQSYEASNYSLSEVNLLTCNIDDNKSDYYSVNDFVVKEEEGNVVHLNVYLDGFLLETFAGDGLIVSTPTGSTAYNYSVGGAILYQELRGFQLSPIAPLSTKAYRSMLNPIVMDEDSKLTIEPKSLTSIYIDGMKLDARANKKYEFSFGKKSIKKLVFDQNWYWESIRNKFL